MRVREFLRLLRKDIPMKILALVIAVALWFAAQGAQGPFGRGEEISAIVDVPLQVQGLGQNLAVLEAPRVVKVHVRGGGDNLLTSMRSSMAYVNLRGKGAGRYAVPVAVSVPEGVQVLDVRPDVIQVQLEPIVKKQMKVIGAVAVPPELDLGTGGEVKVSLSPESVTVEGRQTLVQEVARVIAVIDPGPILSRSKEPQGQAPPEGSDLGVSVVIAVDQHGGYVSDVSIFPDTVSYTIERVSSGPAETKGIGPEGVGTEGAGGKGGGSEGAGSEGSSEAEAPQAGL